MTQKLRTTLSARGSPGYRAPELLKEQTAYSKETDIWALGCVMYELAYGKPAFISDFAVSGFRSAEELSMPEIGKSSAGFSRMFRMDMLIPMLEPRYQKRPSAQQLVKSLLRNLSWLSNMLTTGASRESYLEGLAVDNFQLGTDGPWKQIRPRWDDLFLRGSYEQHNAMFEKYQQVSRVRDIVLGRYHPASIWSATRVAWALKYRLTIQCGDEEQKSPRLVFDELVGRLSWADKMYSIKAVDPLAAAFGLALTSSNWTECNTRLQDLKRAYDTLPCELNGESHEADKLWIAFGSEYNSLRALVTGKETAARRDNIRPQIERILARLGEIVSHQTRLLGETHPDTIFSLQCMAWVHRTIGEYEKAIGCLKEAYTAGAKLGSAHIFQAECLLDLAWCYVQTLQPLEIAIPALDTALEACRVVLGDNHPDTKWLGKQRLEYPETASGNFDSSDDSFVGGRKHSQITLLVVSASNPSNSSNL